jgi:hypothetical protein
VESILAARRSEPQSEPGLRALRATALSSQLPPAAIPEYRPLSPSALADFLGEYTLTDGAIQLAGRSVIPGGTLRVFMFDAKPYMHLPGAGDVMLFPTGTDVFTIRAAPGLGIAFTRAANNSVMTVTLTGGGSTLTGISMPRQ